MLLFLEFIIRWMHVLFGIVWIGLLYYFNFVQTEYFKEATADAKKDAVAKLAPRALWWFRWGAMFTFITGVYLLTLSFTDFGTTVGRSLTIDIAALAGTFMFLNVWLIIWPNQKVVCGLVEGDAATSGAKALLASRTNTLFSATMLAGMLSAHSAAGGIDIYGSHSDLGFTLAFIILLLLQINAIYGKIGPMKTISGVIHSSIVLAVIVFGLIHYL